MRFFRSYGYHQDISMNKSKHPADDDWFRVKVGLSTLVDVARSQIKMKGMIGPEPESCDMKEDIRFNWMRNFVLPSDFDKIYEDALGG